MTKARDISDLLDINGDVKLGSLDNVPASNNASALSTGTLPIARIADGAVTNAKIDTVASTKITGTITPSDSTVSLAKLTATGTASASTFLRGDNSWGSAGASAGQVIQVLSATDRTPRSTTSTSFVTASNTCSVTITPSSASNKILILATVSGSPTYNMGFTIFRAGTNVTASAVGFRWGGYQNQAATGISFLDSPNTTSSTTYDVRFRVDGGTGWINDSGEQSTITVLEVKG